MSKKRIKDNGILFCGRNASEVTGSITYIKFNGKKILLECGLHQSSSNSYLDSYKVNSKKFPFKPSEIDYVFVNHVHIDHIGLLPRLVKEGFSGKIISTTATMKIATLLLGNCSFILEDEARVLSKRYGREYSPIYTLEDVHNTMKLFCDFNEYHTIFHLDDTISFQWLYNSHCVGAAQLQLVLTDGINTKKILYTSDIGALNTNNHYVENTEIPTMFNDVTIMESTYGNPERTSKKTRKFDVEHLRVAIDTVLERNGTVILPAFSFSRSQEILTILYELYGKDKSFDYVVAMDSLLTCDVTDMYEHVLDEKSLEQWNEVRNWENLRLIRDKEESKMCVGNASPKIVISSSGFCTNGRVIGYLEKYLRDRNSMIIFSGYVGNNESYLSYRIKNYKHNKTININKKPVPNRADTISLSTFSSHADFNDLVKYGSNLKTNKLILVHGDIDAKENLKKKLKDAISENDRTYKVVCSEKDMVVDL